ncbi:hypothetical protein ACQZV8_04485 [Magnetococcales bacterium HHB-1]
MNSRFFLWWKDYKVDPGVWIILSLICMLVPRPGVAEVEISPSEVYVQVERIAQELKLIQRHFGVQDKKQKTRPFKARLKPRHVWQKSYEVLVKINIFRARHNMPRITPNAMEPVLDLDPMLVYEQTQRILTELAIIRTRLNIPGTTTLKPVVGGKKPIDVFNQLHQISLMMEMLNAQKIDPNHVFAEVMRLDEDVSSLLRRLGIKDDTYPPARKKKVIPKDSFLVAFEFMKEIQRLQRFVGIGQTNFSAFKKRHNVQPADVFNIIGMCLAEFQLLKAHYNDRRVTPAAEYLDNKLPDDVEQMLQWITRKLRLIKTVK